LVDHQALITELSIAVDRERRLLAAYSLSDRSRRNAADPLRWWGAPPSERGPDAGAGGRRRRGM